MAEDSASNISVQFWSLFNERKWDEAKKLLADNFEAYWPQSREKIVGPDNYIEINRIYPGTHKIDVQDVSCKYDSWEHSHKVTTVVFIQSKMPDGKEVKLYAVSFFEINSDKLITSVTEYWADTYESPEWRKHLVERC